ncbi:MAG: DNA-protecting protein DprA, partial [Oscillospiraceae bacterium]|nr:DNA-protecting protein DprA [Oscillospiraceae bacterium]
MAALKYWLWLSSAGLSPNAKAALLGCFGDAEAVFHAPDGAYSGVKGVTRSEAAILERRDLSLAEDVYAECERQGLQMLSLQDAAYPTRLKHIFAPPVVLYVKGRLPDMETQPPIAVIGTRRGSDYGLRMASALAGEIVRCGGVVISLLTGGIERAAAQSALREGGGCIGVLATAHERETHSLAARVAESGALISEYPPFTRTVNSFFRDRNRIAAGLSAGVLVVEAPERSGTHLFVQEAA